MKKFFKWSICLIVLLIALVCLGYGYYKYQLSPVSKDKTMKSVTIGSITGGQIAVILKDNGLIRDANIFKLYLKVRGISNLKSGIYQLNKSMGVKNIVELISSGKGTPIGQVDLLFKEGKNIRQIEKVIIEGTNNSKNELYNILNDKTYIDSLISKYWFLSGDIKNPNIYYPLEGYLAPNTYRFTNKNVTEKTIIETMLNQTNKILTKYKSEIQSSKYSIHDLMTLASIVELEGVSAKDRAEIAGVFYNRLEKGWLLGSDVTTYYAFKIDDFARDLKVSELNTYNPYNTRGPQMAGKLPVGPICNPSESSIKAVIEPVDSDYMYFVADKYGEVYFTKTLSEHNKKIAELKQANLWLILTD